MKSRISSFNTALRKNITRFAPCWVLYTLFLVLYLTTASISSDSYWDVRNIADWITGMVGINLLYAALTAQLLFGDLFNSRMCNALHAMPLRRENWYAANVTAGLLFSLIPTLITTLIALPMCTNSAVADGWQIPLYWLLGSNLSYICFFGIAALCVQLTGNRFAMAVVYGILNAAPFILYTLVDTLYTPMLYGVRIQSEPFAKWSPVYMTDYEFLDVQRIDPDLLNGPAAFTVGDGWGRLFLWAAVGIALLVLSLVLYRKRPLECAGDFLAFRKLEPVFLLVYTIIVATLFDIFGLFSLVFVFIGLPVGWFTGRMLLKRTIRVFQWKAIGGCALLIAVAIASLLACTFDVFGIASWIPDSGEVKAAYVSMGYSGGEYIPSDAAKLTSPEDIEKVLRVHELALEPQEEPYLEPILVETVDGEPFYEYRETSFSFTLIYELENGRTVYRYYHGYANTELGEILTPWFSSIEVVLGVSEEELDEIADSVVETYMDGIENPLTKEQIRSLLDAIAADCRAGHMAQRWSFHTAECGEQHFTVDFSYTTNDRLHYWLSVSVYDCCENVCQWMEDNDMWDILEESSGKY